jgi:hypothetical protein
MIKTIMTKYVVRIGFLLLLTLGMSACGSKNPALDKYNESVKEFLQSPFVYALVNSGLTDSSAIHNRLVSNPKFQKLMADEHFLSCGIGISGGMFFIYSPAEAAKAKKIHHWTWIENRQKNNIGEKSGKSVYFHYNHCYISASIWKIPEKLLPDRNTVYHFSLSQRSSRDPNAFEGGLLTFDTY